MTKLNCIKNAFVSSRTQLFWGKAWSTLSILITALLRLSPYLGYANRNSMWHQGMKIMKQIGVSIFSEKDLGGKLTSWSETPADHEGARLCVIQTVSKLLVLYPWEALTISRNVFTKMHLRVGMVDTPPLSYPIPRKWCSPGGKGELVTYMNTGEGMEQPYDWLYQLINGT